MYLLDTNVISELRKINNGRYDKNVLNWTGDIHPTECYISVITLFEIELGCKQITRKDKKTRRDAPTVGRHNQNA